MSKKAENTKAISMAWNVALVIFNCKCNNSDMANTIEYKCPSCGGILEFDSSSQKMKCPYCESSFDIDSLNVNDEILYTQQADELDLNLPDSHFTDEESSSFGVYKCDSCGAEIIADDTTASTSCPYCNNVIILTGRLSGELKPDCIIPFKVDKKAAVEALRNHFKDKKLLPKVFTNENHLDEVKGVYVPYWLFDATATVDATYRMTKTRVWSDMRYQYTETSFYGGERRGTMDFLCVPADGSSQMDDTLMESLEVFDYSELTDFKTAYLAGYFANRYDVDSQKVSARIKERMSSSVNSAINNTVNGYQTVSRQSANLTLSNSRLHYALFPVWILNTTWRGKKYVFAMNGQSGKFVGDLPMDRLKYLRMRLLYTGLFGAGIYALFQFMLNMM